MMLVFLAFVLAVLPLVFLSAFPKLALVSVYAGLAHLLVLVFVLSLIWFAMRQKAISRVWRRKSR
jgi:hypothetical protein